MKKRYILLPVCAVLVIGIIYIVVFRGFSFSKSGNDTGQQLHLTETIKSEIQNSIPTNVGNMLFDGIDSISVALINDGVSISARASHDYDIPSIADVLCPIGIEVVKKNNRPLSSITINYYEENSDGIITNSMVDWHTSNGETGMFTIAANQTFQPNTSISDLREYYSQTAKTDEKISENTTLPKAKAAKADPAVGMSEIDVRVSTWGSPKKINKTTTAYGVREQWVYDRGYIYIENGYVTAIQEK